MFNLIRHINVRGSTNSRITTNRSVVTTQTRYRLGGPGRRAINSSRRQPPFSRSIDRPYHFRFNSVGDESETRRKKATVVESTSEPQRQVEYPIPESTWSLQDLDLTSTHTAITEQELRRLARLVLVDLCTNNNHGDDIIVNLMKGDLGNMLHMIQHVTMHDYQESIRNDEHDSSDNSFDDKQDPTANAKTYDTVRGLRGMPLRKAIDLDPLQEQDTAQALGVLEQKLLAKMVRRDGGHKYFAIKTTES